MKKCTMCGIEKELNDFYKNKSTKDGLTYSCKKCDNIRFKKHREKNKNKFKEKRRLYYQSNIEKEKIVKLKYYQKNKKDIIKKQAVYVKNKIKTNPEYALKSKTVSRIASIIRDGKLNNFQGSKSERVIELLGCSLKEYSIYMENLFTEGMSWKNHGLYGWHIDHIKPLSSFNLNDEVELHKAFHYTNTQPLWAIDNLKKGNK